MTAASPSGKLCILDARPKANAMANAMTGKNHMCDTSDFFSGGGYENTLYYENTYVLFASIAK